MLVGGWWQRLPPLRGELLTSCLARNAAAHGATPARFLALFWRGDPTWERDLDREPAALQRLERGDGAPDWLSDIASRLGVERGVVEDATLVAERRKLAGYRCPGGDTPLVLSAGVHHRTRTRHALQFCRDCLEEGTPYFRKAWRLGFMVTCDQHGIALADACPHCDAPLAPHRSITRKITGCHRCGRSIVARARDTEAATAGTSVMQGWMSALLAGEDGAVPAPWTGREAFDAVRALLAVSAAAPVRYRLRDAFALGGMEAPCDRMRFEHARLAVRAPWLETVAAWMADWPRSFRDGADAAGVTRRTFARVRLPPALVDEVSRLPIGVARDRTWKPVLEEPVLRRLRRTDREAYRAVRAERILAHCGYAP